MSRPLIISRGAIVEIMIEGILLGAGRSEEEVEAAVRGLLEELRVGSIDELRAINRSNPLFASVVVDEAGNEVEP